FSRAVFLTRLPPPPLSTLFPYTTLFRSRYYQDSQVLNLPLIFRHADEVAHVRKQLDPVLRQGFKENGWTVFGPIDGGFAYFMTKDRKSTRLNSSHVSISYAVFCLKKKKS